MATLCVASATPKGRPRMINAGNCTRPAPPPDKAEKALASNEMIKMSICSDNVMPERLSSN